MDVPPELTLLPGQQRTLARDIVLFLSRYKHISDAYVIEFFSEGLWETLPQSWQDALDDLSGPQIADLLLDRSVTHRRYPSVWPLTLLAYRASAHALAFPRMPQGGGSMPPDEFQANHSQSAMLRHIYRKHVKPKKQHEIRSLGKLVRKLCEKTNCYNVVDVGSGQGHLTRFLSFGLGLTVTGIEADAALVSMATKFDDQLVSTLEKESQKKNQWHHHTGPRPRHVTGWVDSKSPWEDFVKQLDGDEEPSKNKCLKSLSEQRNKTSCPGRGQNSPADTQDGPAEAVAEAPPTPCSPSHRGKESLAPGFILTGLHACGDLSATLLHHYACCPQACAITSVACCYMKITNYPMSRWVGRLPGHQLSYKAREGACHATEDYVGRLREDSELLKTHCYRAVLETVIRGARPHLRRFGIQTIKKAHLLSFSEYARLGLPRVGLPADLPLDHIQLDGMLQQQGRVVLYFSLALLLAPVVESLVLLDRMLFLQENGLESSLVPLFDPAFSPRNMVLVSMKPERGQAGSHSAHT